MSSTGTVPVYVFYLILCQLPTPTPSPTPPSPPFLGSPDCNLVFVKINLAMSAFRMSHGRKSVTRKISTKLYFELQHFVRFSKVFNFVFWTELWKITKRKVLLNFVVSYSLRKLTSRTKQKSKKQTSYIWWFKIFSRVTFWELMCCRYRRV